MMANLTVSVNTVMNEQAEEEEDKGYVNVARGNYHGEDNGGWRMPDDSWLGMEAEEEPEQSQSRCFWSMFS
jgi:hypothetical protein